MFCFTRWAVKSSPVLVVIVPAEYMSLFVSSHCKVGWVFGVFFFYKVGCKVLSCSCHCLLLSLFLQRIVSLFVSFHYKVGCHVLLSPCHGHYCYWSCRE